ncbi:MAG: tetratricopeptide repeat protein [Chloroflexota bacterium]
MIELLLQAERAMSVGMLDRAETLYRQVANADPRNSIAVVGLARVALDRGDEEGALDLGRRALEIDPENDAAIRLVARLEEVIDYRTDAAAALGLDEAPATQPASGPQSEQAEETKVEPEPEPAPEPAPEPEREPESQAQPAPEPEPQPEPA